MLKEPWMELPHRGESTILNKYFLKKDRNSWSASALNRSLNVHKFGNKNSVDKSSSSPVHLVILRWIKQKIWCVTYFSNLITLISTTEEYPHPPSDHSPAHLVPSRLLFVGCGKDHTNSFSFLLVLLFVLRPSP